MKITELNFKFICREENPRLLSSFLSLAMIFLIWVPVACAAPAIATHLAISIDFLLCTHSCKFFSLICVTVEAIIFLRVIVSLKAD